MRLIARSALTNHIFATCFTKVLLTYVIISDCVMIMEKLMKNFKNLITLHLILRSGVTLKCVSIEKTSKIKSVYRFKLDLN